MRLKELVIYAPQTPTVKLAKQTILVSVPLAMLITPIYRKQTINAMPHVQQVLYKQASSAFNVILILIALAVKQIMYLRVHSVFRTFF